MGTNGKRKCRRVQEVKENKHVSGKKSEGLQFNNSNMKKDSN